MMLTCTQRLPRRYVLALAFLAAAAFAFPAFAVEANFHFAPTYWNTSLSGDGQTGRGTESEQFDIDDDLGLDTTESVPSLDFFFRWGKNRFIIAWNRSDYAGSDHLDADLVFHGLTFPEGGKIESVLDFDRTRYIYGRPVLETKRSGLDLLMGVETYEIDSSVLMSGVGKKRVNVDATIPVLGMSVVFFPLPTMRLYGEAVATNLDHGHTESRILDLYGSFEYYFVGQSIGIVVGYRLCNIKAKEEGDAGFDLQQRGPFTGLVFRL